MGFNFYAIKKQALPTMPKGVQNFVLDFFEEKTIFGIDCYVAIDGDYKSPYEGENLQSNRYTKGLTEKQINDCGVFSYFQQNPEIVFDYYWS